jgi:hypothetical protein
MTKFAGAILGATAAGAVVWFGYAIFLPVALTDAQSVLLFVPRQS